MVIARTESNAQRSGLLKRNKLDSIFDEAIPIFPNRSPFFHTVNA